MVSSGAPDQVFTLDARVPLTFIIKVQQYVVGNNIFHCN